MSPETRKTSQEAAEQTPRSHVQALQAWAGRLSNPDFTPTPDDFDALTRSASYIYASEEDDGKGKTRLIYLSDIDEKPIPNRVAEKVLDAVKPEHWEVTPDERDISTAIIAAKGPVALKGRNSKAYEAFETYCIKTGKPINADTLSSFAEAKQRRLTLHLEIQDRAASEQAGGDLDKDRLIRSLSHLVTRVVSSNPATPDGNLQAQMETVNAKTKAVETVTLTNEELERIKSLSPEIEAGIRLKESPLKTIEERTDEEWLAENRDEIVKIRRNSYIANGRSIPAKGWKPDDLNSQAKRGERFDKLTEEEKLGLVPLPDSEVMPPITIMLPKPKTEHYGATSTPPIKGGVAGFIPALTRHKGKNTWEVADVFGTALAGPLVRGGIAAAKYATGAQRHEENAEADARVAHLDALGKEANAYGESQKQRVNGIQSEMERAQELEKIVREIAQRRNLRGAKQSLSVKALSHILAGRDPARKLDQELRAYRLTVADLLPGFDFGDDKRKDKTKR